MGASTSSKYINLYAFLKKAKIIYLVVKYILAKTRQASAASSSTFPSSSTCQTILGTGPQAKETLPIWRRDSKGTSWKTASWSCSSSSPTSAHGGRLSEVASPMEEDHCQAQGWAKRRKEGLKLRIFCINLFWFSSLNKIQSPNFKETYIQSNSCWFLETVTSFLNACETLYACMFSHNKSQIYPCVTLLKKNLIFVLQKLKTKSQKLLRLNLSFDLFQFWGFPKI